MFICAGVQEYHDVMPVVVDCLSSVYVTHYSSQATQLPSSSVSFENGLPRRISFFLVDPVDFMNVMGKSAASQGSVLSSILSLLNRTAADPYITAVYLSMASHGYESGDYLLMGSFVISYPEGTTIEELTKIWSERTFVNGNISIFMDLVIYGKKLSAPLSLYGEVSLHIDEEKHIVLENTKDFRIDGLTYDVEKIVF